MKVDFPDQTMSSKNRKCAEAGHHDESFSDINAEITTCDDSLDGLSFGYFKGPFSDGNLIEYEVW